MIFINDYMYFLRNIYDVNKKIKNIMLYNVLFSIIFVCISISVPYMLKITVDSLSLEKIPENAYRILGVVLLYSVIWTTNQLLLWMRTLLTAPLLANCDSTSQMLLYLHIIKVKYDIVKNMDMGLLYATMTRCRAAFSALSFSFIWAVLPIFVQIALGSTLIFITLGIPQGIIILFSVIVLLFSSLYFSSKTTQSHILSFNSQNILSVHFNEKTQSIVEIKTNNSYFREYEIIEKVSRQYQKQILKSSKGLSLTLIKQSILSGVVFTITHLCAAWFVFTKNMSLGDFVLMSGYVVSLIVPFNAVTASFSNLKKNHLALQEGISILNLEVDKTGSVILKDLFSVLDVQNFKTPYSKYVINLRVNTGEVAVIMGASGIGKTTLLHSIVGLNHDYCGLIRLYGCNVKTVSPLTISSLSSFVQQEPSIFTGTVRENLLYGTDSEVEVTDVQLMSTIDGMCLSYLNEGQPLNYHVGQRGNKLSGGEKRRLAIARAVIRKLPLMILDEPTSGLDENTERSVMSYLASLGTTILIVSHSNNIHRYCTQLINLDVSSASDY